MPTVVVINIIKECVSFSVLPKNESIFQYCQKPAILLEKGIKVYCSFFFDLRKKELTIGIHFVVIIAFFDFIVKNLMKPNFAILLSLKTTRSCWNL